LALDQERKTERYPRKASPACNPDGYDVNGPGGRKRRGDASAEIPGIGLASG